MVLKELKKCSSCSVSFEDYASNKRSSYCSLPCYWQSKKGGSGYWTGKKRSLADRQKISLSRIGKTAKEKHPNWKGGITKEHLNLRHTFEYKEWRKEVFKRDGWTCVLCNYRSKRSDDINADHIKRFSEYPELRHEVSNGRTLCVPCHKEITFKPVWQ